MNNHRGVAVIEVLAALALVSLATAIFSPSLIPGTEAYRAKKSTQATRQIVTATASVDAATSNQGAEVAAGITMIGQANASAVDSPTKSFIGREVPHLLSMLPAPSAVALIEAEKRKAAVMEGRAEEARKLYEQAAAKAARLQSERDAAIAARDEAIKERQAVDLALEKAAAAEHARTMQAAGALFVALCIGGFALYLKLYGVGPATLGNIVADIRSGTAPLQAIDTFLPPRMFGRVKKAAKLATE